MSDHVHMVTVQLVEDSGELPTVVQLVLPDGQMFRFTTDRSTPGRRHQLKMWTLEGAIRPRLAGAVNVLCFQEVPFSEH